MIIGLVISIWAMSDLNSKLELSISKATELQSKVESLETQLETSNSLNESLNEQIEELGIENDELTEQNLRFKEALVLPPAKNSKGLTVSRGLYAREVINVRATAYGIDYKGSNMKGITFTGTKATEERTIAVDPKVIPLGSEVYVEVPSMPQYNGYYIAEDTGGAIKGKKIDIYVGTEKVAYPFGIRDAVVKVVRFGYSK